jgi:dipeptidyl aminopeptidase/acylaminoacyl peptidase
MRTKILLAGALGVVAVACVASVYALTRPDASGSRPKLSKPEGLSPAACFLGGGPAQEVQIPLGDGRFLEGGLVGSGDVGIVLAHQAEASMCQWADYAHVLAKRGYRVLALDFPMLPDAPSDADSVVDAAKALRLLGAKRIVLMGASRGGTAVLDAAGKFKADAVIALSAPASYNGSDALQGVETSTAPLLIAVGEEDTEFVGDDVSLEHHARAKSKQLIVKKGSGEHGVLLLEYSGHSIVDDAVLKLLARVKG